jgi:short-subunit dehydrogenase
MRAPADASGRAASPGGWIVNISSMAGRVPLPGCSYYGAAKSGLAMASQIAAVELAAAGIHVLTVLPGPVRSDLESRARAQVAPGFVSRHIPTGDPGVLADRIERALARGCKRLVYPGFYRLANQLVGTSTWLAANIGPAPTDAP